ncbi:PREDICTED: chymotrypsin-elastase inhibitor ixodidin-like [Nicrophorus vespilloides]|uniref:Chymotrypsin-elastase inhibitor ixodidin-like n=1 Tax=Nicrophorus vespilloides TaxID=110193 RepID=A0ABM1MZJ0_NICVS|nr:PREDICTED: chymotrypsin-elastase inhibitor ixodidin-like [Nicrophorus vespilloides]
MSKLLTIFCLFVCVGIAMGGMQCSSGQAYSRCGSGCSQICGDDYIPFCEVGCVPGCFCPKGQLIDRKTGRCIPCQPNLPE